LFKKHKNIKDTKILTVLDNFLYIIIIPKNIKNNMV